MLVQLLVRSVIGEYGSGMTPIITMTQVVSDETVVADFNDVQLDFLGERFTLYRDGDAFMVRIEDTPSEDLQGLMQLLEQRNYRRGDPAHGFGDGFHHMQVFWLPAYHGNMQIGFPFTWLIEEKKWVRGRRSSGIHTRKCNTRSLELYLYSLSCHRRDSRA